MVVQSTKRLLCAAFLGALATASFTSVGSAATFVPAKAVTVESQLHTIQYHRGERADRRQELRYDRRHHGERHRQRRHGYTHYYNGYYYATPWWAVAPSVRLPRHEPARIHRTNQRHIRWCLNQYRSYNPDTNLYVARDGRRYQCRSPFM